MKRLIATPMVLLVAALFTVMLARGVAYAQECSDVIIGTGGVSCDLDGQDANYCYYTCDCGSHDEATCCSRMADMGVECIESGNAH